MDLGGATNFNSDQLRLVSDAPERPSPAAGLLSGESGGWFIFKPVPSVVNSRFFDV